MFKPLVLIAALAAASCATPGDIYASEVDLSETSSRPLAAVSRCLQLRWAEAPITAPDGQLSFPMKNGHGQVLGMLTLTSVPEGTLIELRKTGQMLFGGQDWLKCV